MAKVIGHKQIVKKRYKATCEHCGAVILFEDEETKEEMQYNEYCFSTGQCPECGNKVHFNKYKARVKGCPESCDHQKNGQCTYKGTDWRECPIS